jgi:Tannase and feruloyl esterase
MEAQRFPDDFDGIVVGAPAHDFVGMAAQFVRDVQAVFPDPRNLSAPMFTPETLKSVEAQIAVGRGPDGARQHRVLRRGPEARRWFARLLPVVPDARCPALQWRAGTRYGGLAGDAR